MKPKKALRLRTRRMEHLTEMPSLFGISVRWDER